MMSISGASVALGLAIRVWAASRVPEDVGDDASDRADGVSQAAAVEEACGFWHVSGAPSRDHHRLELGRVSDASHSSASVGCSALSRWTASGGRQLGVAVVRWLVVALWFTPPLCRGSVPSDAARVSGPRIEPPKEAGGAAAYTYRGDTESGSASPGNC